MPAKLLTYPTATGHNITLDTRRTVSQATFLQKALKQCNKPAGIVLS